MPSNKYKANKAVLLNWLETQTKRSNLFIHFEEINKKSEALRKIILYFKNNKNDRFVFFLLRFFVLKTKRKDFYKAKKKKRIFRSKKERNVDIPSHPTCMVKKYKYDLLLLVFLLLGYALLYKFWRISLYVTDDVVAKLYVT